MSLLPSSKNAADLRVENLVDPGRRRAASAASVQIRTDVVVGMQRGTTSVASATAQVYSEWRAEVEAKPPKDTSYKRLEARVYEAVCKNKTPAMPIAQGRQLLRDAMEPGLTLDDVLRILQSITAAVRYCGATKIRSPGWPHTALSECPYPVQQEKRPLPAEFDDSDDDDDTTTDDDDSESAPVFKPVPPPRDSAVAQPRKTSFKSSGGRAPKHVALTPSAAPLELLDDLPLPSPSPPPPAVAPPSGPTGHELWTRVTEFDNMVLTTWAQTRDIDAVDRLLHKHAREIDSLDHALVETHEQLTHSLLLNRLFHEKGSRSSYATSRDVGYIILNVLKGCLSGETFRGYPRCDPGSPSNRALMEIATRESQWKALVASLTFHLHNDVAGRTEARRALDFKRTILLSERL